MRSALQPGRTLIIVVCTASGIIGLFVLVIVGHGMLDRRAAIRESSLEIQAAKEQGYPMTAEHLHAAYPPPKTADGRESGELYLRVAEIFRQQMQSEAGGEPSLNMRQFWQGQAPRRGEPWPETLHMEATAYLEQMAEARGLLHDAAAMGPAWFDIDFESGQMATALHLTAFSHGAPLLKLEMVERAGDGRVDAAIDSIEAMYRLTEALRDEPLSISQVTRFTVLNHAIDATQRLLLTESLAEPQLARLQMLAEIDLDMHEAILRAMVGHRALTNVTVDQISRGEQPREMFVAYVGPAIRDRRYPTEGRAALERLRAEYLAEARALISMAERNELEPFLDDDLAYRWPYNLPIYDSLIGLVLVPNRIIRVAARQQAARLAIAAARHKQEHGSYPESLDELVPAYLDEVPTDIFSSMPMRYRRTETGAIVYSVGPNRTDHGGRELNDDGEIGRGADNTDITFTLGDAQAELWPEQWPSDQTPHDMPQE